MSGHDDITRRRALQVLAPSRPRSPSASSRRAVATGTHEHAAQPPAAPLPPAPAFFNARELATARVLVDDIIRETSTLAAPRREGPEFMAFIMTDETLRSNR